ncbi:MAG: type IX secretion system protein PorQ [Cyclobacteriaceae bacterium]|nr:type IX secretion system protein PorQ [Cyclobacteriaceae bacterium]
MNRILLFVFCLFTLPAVAQIGGEKAFEFLNVPGYARLAALGGVNVSLTDRDINFFQANPSAVGDTLAGMASASYQFYVADIGQATFSYAHPFKKIGVLMFGIQHMRYGNIKSYDAAGAELGDFASGETVLMVGKSHRISNFRMGANVKFAFSNIAGYRASAVMLDVGGVFIHPDRDFRVGLVIKNFGVVLSEYSESSKSLLPFDVQLGATFKPEHMPFRFSLTAYNLTQRELPYYNPDDGTDEPSTLNKVMSRINFGVELLLHRNVNVLAGYNYLRHQELKLSNGGGGAGVTFGFSARIKTVEFVFSRSGYVAGQAGYAFTLSTNVNKLLTRRSI